MAKARIGVAGLGVMGASLALNMAGRGFAVALYNRTAARIDETIEAAGDLSARLVPSETPEALAGALASPRAILIMVKAGAAVDATIEALLPHLEPGDILIDAGNADFHDTIRRHAGSPARGPLPRPRGLGRGGGRAPRPLADGRRRPGRLGGRLDMLTAIAARYQDVTCAALLGPDGAGHFVKTVHNGIEYADMQLIAEIYGLLARGEGRKPAEIAALFRRMERRAAAELPRRDHRRGAGRHRSRHRTPVVDVILDSAGQKGTGRWTVIEALKLGQSASVIEAAVGARAWSADRRGALARRNGAARPARRRTGPPVLDTDLERALLAGRVIAWRRAFRCSKPPPRRGVGARPRPHRRDLAGRLHHPLGAAGRHRRGAARGPARRHADAGAAFRRRILDGFRGRAAPRGRGDGAGPAGPGAVGGAGLLRHAAPRARHRQPDPGASATSSARMASSGWMPRATTTGPGTASAPGAALTAPRPAGLLGRNPRRPRDVRRRSRPAPPRAAGPGQAGGGRVRLRSRSRPTGPARCRRSTPEAPARASPSASPPRRAITCPSCSFAAR
jgi:6-phosphogluconate dehydrogenase